MLRGLAGKKSVRDFHQNARAIAGARIGADRAAMLKIAQDVQSVGNDLVRTLAFDVGNKADAAKILFERGIVKTLGGAPIVLARNFERFRSRGCRQRVRHDVLARELRPAHLKKSSQSGLARQIYIALVFPPIVIANVRIAHSASSSYRRTLGVAVPTGPPLVRREPQLPEFRSGRSRFAENAPPAVFWRY